MRRLCAIGLLCLAMAGCQWPSKPGVDPFLGPTRVDPPATGSIQGPVPGASPYLGPAPSAAGPNVSMPGPAGSYTPSYTPSAAPAYTPASPQTLPGPAPNSSYSPPGGFNYRQGSVDRTKAVSPSPTSATSQGAILANGSRSSAPGEAAGQSSAAEESADYVEEQDAGAVRTSHEEAIRLVGPTDSETADGEGLVATAATQPRRLDPPGDAIDIMELPKAGTSSAAKTAAKGDSFRVVGTSAGVRPQTVSSSSSPAESRYGRDPGYRWLKGQLEYSEVSRQWKLRYIPIDGQTDQYGGSVVLGDSPLLKDLKQGDFVMVQGTVAGKNAENGGFAPTYRLDQIN